MRHYQRSQISMMSRRLSIGRRLTRLLVVGFLALTASGCARSSEESHTDVVADSEPVKTPRAHEIRFTDVAKASGVSWSVRNGEEAGRFTLLESLGAGCAVDDYDGDGKPDIFLGGGGQFGSSPEIQSLPLGLFRQTSDWKFAPTVALAGLEPIRHYHHGLWTVDHDEDGFPDLLVTGWGGLQLFHNQGDGTFVDITQFSGLTDSLWSVPAGWADVNQDQILDLFVGHYVDWSMTNNPVCNDRYRTHRSICGPTNFNGLPCTLYLGQGDGTYRDASHEMGIHDIGKSLGAVIADFTNDNLPDIYVANDTLPNQLYVSLPSGGYREAAISSGVAFGDGGSTDGSMGVDAGDINGDGQADLCVANYEKQSFAFYRNLGPDLFTHASLAYGVTAVGAEAVGFGTVIFDADGDGRSDIFCTNGHIFPPTFPVERRQLPYLFWNNNGRRLVNVAGQAGEYMGQRHLGRGAASADLDGNGTPDLVVTHTNEPAAILRNETSIPHWLSVRLIGRASPRSAIGAKVTLISEGHRQVGLIKGGGSYLSTSDRTLLFGLGSHEAVDSLEVLWPSGKVTVRKNIEINQHLVLVEESL